MSVMQNSSACQELIKLAANMGQATNERDGNLGFGYIYYGLARLFYPEVVLCIGSYRGFSPVCFTLGLSDNNKGKCYFIDPGKVDGYWHDPGNFNLLNTRFELNNRMIHIRKTSQEVIAANLISEPIDIFFIDGDHSYEGVKFDFDNFTHMVRPGGLILFHDSITEGRGFTPWEVKKFLEAELFDSEAYENVTFPLAAGLSVFRKLAP